MGTETSTFSAQDVRDIVVWMESWVSGERTGRMVPGYRGDVVDYLFAAVGLLHHQDLVYVGAEHQQERREALAALGAQAVTLREMGRMAAALAECLGAAGDDFADHPSVLGQPVRWHVRTGSWLSKVTTTPLESLQELVQTGLGLLAQPAVSPLAAYLRGQVKHVDLLESELSAYECHLGTWRASLAVDLSRAADLSRSMHRHLPVARAEALTDQVLAARPALRAQLERLGARLHAPLLTD